MNRPVIPDDIKRLVLLSIPSVPYLEALLLLRGNATQAWRCSVVAQRLYLSDKETQNVLDELVLAGVLTIDERELPAYRYQPKSENLCQMIDRLAAIYATNLVDVTHLIHSKMNKKAQQFADAFVWRKES